MAKNLNDLGDRIIHFVDNNDRSVIISRDSHPFYSYLAMEYEGNGFKVYFRVQVSPYSNGSSEVRVVYKGKVVLKASGDYISQVGNMKARVYVPGRWEKFFKRIR